MFELSSHPIVLNVLPSTLPSEMPDITVASPLSAASSLNVTAVAATPNPAHVGNPTVSVTPLAKPLEDLQLKAKITEPNVDTREIRELLWTFEPTMDAVLDSNSGRGWQTHPLLARPRPRPGARPQPPPRPL